MMSRVDELLAVLEAYPGSRVNEMCPSAADAFFELEEMARKSEPKHADTVVWELPT